jgi:hypothetical protein
MDPRHAEKMIFARKLWRDMNGAAHGIPDPPNWLFNQPNMRMMYEIMCMGLSEGKSRSDLTPEFIKYFKFMYESFPPGYSDIILDEYHRTHPTAIRPTDIKAEDVKK